MGIYPYTSQYTRIKRNQCGKIGRKSNLKFYV